MPTEIKAISRVDQLIGEIEARLVQLRSLAVDPVNIHYADNLSFEVRPVGDDDRILVFRKGWGCTGVNYTHEGVIIDVQSEEFDGNVHTASIFKEDLVDTSQDDELETSGNCLPALPAPVDLTKQASDTSTIKLSFPLDLGMEPHTLFPVFGFVFQQQGTFIYEPMLSSCGRFTVDPTKEYGITQLEADQLRAINTALKKATEDAIQISCKVVQDAFGITAGDRAGVYFSDDERVSAMASQIAQYMKFELEAANVSFLE